MPIQPEPNYYAPTVLSGADATMACACEETFGSVAPLPVFDDEAEVVAQANDTPFGLAGYFYSQNVKRIWRVAEALETGIVGINEGAIAAEAAPFGGVKESGYGRDRPMAWTITCTPSMFVRGCWTEVSALRKKGPWWSLLFWRAAAT